MGDEELIKRLRSAFDVGFDLGWDHAREDYLYDTPPLGCEEAFSKFLAEIGVSEDA
jgi:hypothetical protein